MHPFWNAIVKASYPSPLLNPAWSLNVIPAIHVLISAPILQLVPRWVAPNVLTFTGGILLVLSFCLLSYYDWDYRGVASNPSQCPIPPWIWLVCAALMLASHTLDGIDGKQAKRTGSSSPLGRHHLVHMECTNSHSNQWSVFHGNDSYAGELFDHGIDSWSVFLITMTFYSNGGYGRWENGVDNALLPFIATIAGFYVTHWEKYITGTLYLPWFYDISLLVSAHAVHIDTVICIRPCCYLWDSHFTVQSAIFACVFWPFLSMKLRWCNRLLYCLQSITLGNALTFLYGVELYWIYVLPGLELRHAIKWITVLGFFLNLIVSLWNIYVYYRCVQCMSWCYQVHGHVHHMGRRVYHVTEIFFKVRLYTKVFLRRNQTQCSLYLLHLHYMLAKYQHSHWLHYWRSNSQNFS